MKKILMSLLFITPLANANTLQCTGTVDKIGMHASNKIMLKLSSMNTAVYICSPEANWVVSGTTYSTSAEMCDSLLSMLMHAKSTQSNVGDVWFDGDDVPANCNSWESWKKANIRFFLY